MFERYSPTAAFSRGQASDSNQRSHDRTALRAFDWSELAARIEAVRDLRQILRNDALVESSSFADAAGGYFVSEGNNKQRVNPIALEAGKGLADIRVAAKQSAQKAAKRVK